MIWAKIAKNYRVASIVTLILTAVFLLLMLLFQNAHMRGLNVRYLFKYLPSSSLSHAPTEISYATGSGSRFALYHDDLAVIGEGGIALYNPVGDLRFRDEIEKGSAVSHSDGKYLAVFVPGKKTVSLFHSFGKEAELSFDFPVASAAVSESGAAVVCLQTKNGAMLSFLNEKHEMAASVSLDDGIPMELAVSADGKRTAVLLLSTENGAYGARLSVFSCIDGELLLEERFEDARPLGLVFFKNEQIAAILSNGVVFFASNGDKTETISVSEGIKLFAADHERLVILSARGALSCLDMKGKTLFHEKEVPNARAVKLSEDHIFLLGTEALTVLDSSGKQIALTSVPDGTSDFFILYDESILFCTPTEARQIYIKL